MSDALASLRRNLTVAYQEGVITEDEFEKMWHIQYLAECRRMRALDRQE